MRSVLAILMFATMIQIAQADDDDNQGGNQGGTTTSGTATGCITSTTGTVTCL
jgi:hypothetical protein